MEHNRADSQAGGNRDDRGHTMNNVRLRIRLPAVHENPIKAVHKNPIKAFVQ